MSGARRRPSVAAVAALGALGLAAIAGPIAAGDHNGTMPPAGPARGRVQTPDDLRTGISVPGGEPFVRSVLRMGPASSDRLPGGLLVAVADRLARPAAVDLAARLRAAMQDLRELEAELRRLDEEFGAVIPRLGDPGSAAHAKAAALLEWLGLTPAEIDGTTRLRRRVGSAYADRRRLVENLGVRLAIQTRLWAAGEPVGISVGEDRAAVPLGTRAWVDSVFPELSPEELFMGFVDSEPARDVLLGVAQLDATTREALTADPGIAALVDDPDLAGGFRRVAPYLSVGDDGRMALPGADRAAWEAILGPWDDDLQLLRRLVTRDRGKPAHLWRALAIQPAARARYLLTLGASSPEERGAWARRLYEAIRTPDFGRSIRWPDDTAELFLRLRLDPETGTIAWPGGGRAWSAAFLDDEPLRSAADLDALMARVAGTAERGSAIDGALIVALLRGSEPTDERLPAIRAFVLVSDALRYQPVDTVARAIPMLVRSSERFGRAWGLLATPTRLAPGTVVALVESLWRLDALEEAAVRIESIRQMQASLMLARRFLINDLVPAAEVDALLQELLATVPDPELGIGPAALAWWRDRLLPVVGASLVADGWEGDPEDPRAVLVAGLVGSVSSARLEVDGIPYDLDAAATLGRRLQLHIAQQLLPRLDLLLAVDTIAGELESALPEGGRRTADAAQESGDLRGRDADGQRARTAPADPPLVGLAGELAEVVEQLRRRLPANVVSGQLDESLPVPVGRDELFALADGLIVALGAEAAATGPDTDAAAARDEGAGVVSSEPPGRPQVPATAATARRLRAAVTSYLGDALVGVVYALEMGDPASFLYQHGHIAWLHLLEPPGMPDGVSPRLAGAWAPTAEGFAGREGQRLQNSLFGVPEQLGRWNLGEALEAGGDPVAEETWGATLGSIHYPSLRQPILEWIVRRHDRAVAWVRAAAAAADPDLPAAGGPGDAPDGEPPGLRETARRLLWPWELERLVAAIEAGAAERALDQVTPGNRYLLARLLDGNDADLPGELRWSLDQAVGMPLGRRGDYLGLGHPAAVPYGEVGDELADRRLYARLLDVRVELAVALARSGLPAPFAGRLLTDAMAGVLAAAPSTSTSGWHEMLAAIPTVVDRVAVRQWVVDLAFEEEFLEPATPVADDLAEAGAAADPRLGVRDPSGAGLALPAPQGDEQASFEARVDMVLVDVGVWDDDGEFVTDLDVDDFEIFWEDQPVTPAFVRLEGVPTSSIFTAELPPEVVSRIERRPRNFVLVSDLLTTSPQDWERIRADTLEFVRSGIAADDRLALVQIDSRGRPRVLEGFTVDHRRIEDRIEGMEGNLFGARAIQDAIDEISRSLCDNSLCFDPDPASDGTACQEPVSTARFNRCITTVPEWEDAKFQRANVQLGRWIADQRRRSQLVLEALEQIATMAELGDPLDRQKTLVLLSTGFEVQPGSLVYSVLVDYASINDALEPSEVRMPRVDLGDELEGLAASMHRCRCTVYTIGTAGLATFADGPGGGAYAPVVSGSSVRRTLQDPLNAIARDTGGVPFFGSDPGVGYQRILEDTRLRYVIGFAVSAQPRVPAAVDDGEPRWWELGVRVDRPDVEVRAREGFYWPPRRR